jgi:hypothetical protein
MKAGDVFGDWRLVKWLGSGGNAVVWETERDGERGAIKLLTRSSSEAVARFKREIAQTGAEPGSEQSQRRGWCRRLDDVRVILRDMLRQPAVQGCARG